MSWSFLRNQLQRIWNQSWKLSPFFTFVYLLMFWNIFESTITINNSNITSALSSINEYIKQTDRISLTFSRITVCYRIFRNMKWAFCYCLECLSHLFFKLFDYKISISISFWRFGFSQCYESQLMDKWTQIKEKLFNDQINICIKEANKRTNKILFVTE